MALATSSTIFWTAIAVSGVRGDGFQTIVSPQTARDHRVPGPDRDREVERGDDADRPQRLPLLDHAVPRPLAGDRQSVKLARQADGEVAHVDHFLDFALPLGADLAGLQRDQKPEIGLEGTKGGSDLADDFSSPRRRNEPPRSKRRSRAIDDSLVIGGRGRAHSRQRLAGGRVGRMNQTAGGGLNSCAAGYADVRVCDAQPLQEFFEHGSPMGLKILTRNSWRPTGTTDRGNRDDDQKYTRYLVIILLAAVCWPFFFDERDECRNAEDFRLWATRARTAL